MTGISMLGGERSRRMPNGTYGGVRGGLNLTYSIVDFGRTTRKEPFAHII